MVKIAISGASGRMGKSLISQSNTFKNVILTQTLDEGDDLSSYADDFEVLIDFTHPKATLSYLPICAKLGKKMVIGTTGFDNKALQKLNNFATKMAIVFSANMSTGVNITLKLLEQATRIIGDEADIEIVEAHHRHKIDAPSGTALKMGEVIACALGRDLNDCAIYAKHQMNTVRDKKTIGFSSIRGGDVIGEHTTYFFMAGERIEITHKASSRNIFARGALKAALWLKTQKNGLYTMSNVLGLS